MNCGEKLKMLRTGQKMTQQALADRIGVTRQTLAKYETGESLPDIDKCMALADVFG